MLRSTGHLHYSPKSAGGRQSSKWWLVLKCCEDLCAYYRWLFNREYRALLPLIYKPSWGSHISVVRDEQPPSLEAWEKCENEEVEFEFYPHVSGNGEYFWINIGCDRALDIREELGLVRHPEVALHLTIGRIK